MKQKTIITPRTAAVTTEQPIYGSRYHKLFISADDLDGAEEVDIFVRAGTAWVPLGLDGSVVTLTASVPSIMLEGGVDYAVKKDATSGSCGVYYYGSPNASC